MSLYLSRLCLNPLCAAALKLAADPYELHRKLAPTVYASGGDAVIAGDGTRRAGLLFRVDATDQGPVVLMQTSCIPRWDALQLAPRVLRDTPQHKLFQPSFYAGQRLNFRLLCQPSRRLSGQFGTKANGKRKPGPRRACRTDEQRLAWLHRKSHDNGFIVESVGLTLVNWINSKRRQTAGGQPAESYEAAQARAHSGGPERLLGAVRFDGVLVVADPNRFSQAIACGIGPGKAFGFGLLSVAPAT